MDRLSELCAINKSIQFEISVPILHQQTNTVLVVDQASYKLAELEISLDEVEWLARHEKITIIERVFAEKLEKDEYSRTRYSLLIPSSKTITDRPKKWTPLAVISFVGGFGICVMGVVMSISNVRVVGFDTHYGGGYGYHELTYQGALLIGGLVFVCGLFSMPKWWKK